jgi:predicted AAA+ superfamily ATPase
MPLLQVPAAGEIPVLLRGQAQRQATHDACRQAEDVSCVPVLPAKGVDAHELRVHKPICPENPKRVRERALARLQTEKAVEEARRQTELNRAFVIHPRT